MTVNEKYKVQFIIAPKSKDEQEPSIIESTVFFFSKQDGGKVEVEALHRLTGGTHHEIKAVENVDRKYWQYCVVSSKRKS